MSDDAARVAVSSGVSFHPVAGGGVVFDSAGGRLIAVNLAAGLAFLCLAEGKSADESAATLARSFSVEPAVAAEWLDRSLDAFRDLGLLGRPAPPAEAGETRDPQPILPSRAAGGPPGARYRLLDEVFQVTAPPSLLARIESLLGPLRVDAFESGRSPAGARRFDILPDGEGWRIVGSEPATTCADRSLVAELERLVVQSVVPAIPHLLALHSAALQRDGHTILLVAPSGSGKTTLSVALARAGWDFATDELVLLGRDDDLRALPLPACIKAESFAQIEAWFPALRDAPEHDRYGRIVKYLPMRPRPLQPSRVHVVFPRFDAKGGDQIRALPGFAGLEKLLAQCVFVPSGFRREDVDRLLRWHGGLDYCDLDFSDCAAAASLLDSMLAPTGASGGHAPGAAAELTQASRPGA